MMNGTFCKLVLSLLLYGFCSVLASDDPHPGLLDPSKATETAPETFRVKLETTKGDLVITVTRAWAPLGADRFYNLVKIGYFTDIAFYRVIAGFVAQFGFSGDPAINAKWSRNAIKDDPVKASNTVGKISFAMSGPHTRATQFFINMTNNSNLDGMGFSPFGEIEGDGLSVIKSLYGGYGEGAPRGRGPHQGKLSKQGKDHLKDFPKLDYIKKAHLID